MREKILFSDNWQFLEEVPEERFVKTKSGTYLSAKTERLKWGPGSYWHIDMPNHWDLFGELTPERWENVDLPHDYIIRQTPDEKETGALGFFKYHEAWYRKHFKLEDCDRNRRITVYFEGVTGNAEVYLNSCFLCRSTSGYVPFEVDITDLVRFGEDNVLAVHVDPDSREGWWYQGGGIYRNVWMIKTAQTAIDLHGVFLPVEKMTEERWKVPVEVEVFNIGYEPEEFDVSCEIFTPQGELLTEFRFPGSVPARDRRILRGETTVNAPELWDIEHTVRYTAKVHLLGKDGKCFDTYEQKFGFRTIHFSATEGFFLNGRHLMLKGVCAHQDFGLTGKAVPDNISRYKVKLCKEMGANAYRAAHYPHPEAVMEACDTLGLLVLDENRRFESNPETLKHVEMQIKRDRNHPSVVLWCTGNEEMVYHTVEQGCNIQKALTHKIKQLDPTRLVTCAMTNIYEVVLQDACEVIGSNYHLTYMDDLHSKTPEKPYISTENCAVGSCRGWYYGDCAEIGRLDARDREMEPSYFGDGREDTWKMITARPWISGSFQWAAFEHRGEAIWPRLSSVSGAYDLFCQKKDAFYQNQSHWLETPMIHILPHWTHPGMEGMPIEVCCYTNCDEAELFLNGVSLGRKQVPRYTRIFWQVTYEPGKLEVHGFNNGVKVAEKSFETCGKPEKLLLIPETPDAEFNGQDMAVYTCVALDAAGREFPADGIEVRFSVSGAGKLAGTGSDNADHVPVTSCTRCMYAGRISAGVKCLKDKGDSFILRADACGLISAVLEKRK